MQWLWACGIGGSGVARFCQWASGGLAGLLALVVVRFPLWALALASGGLSFPVALGFGLPVVAVGLAHFCGCFPLLAPCTAKGSTLPLVVD